MEYSGNKPVWQDFVMDRAIARLERDKNHPSILIWSCGNESYAGEVIRNVSNYFRELESRMYAEAVDIEEYLNNDPQHEEYTIRAESRSRIRVYDC